LPVALSDGILLFFFVLFGRLAVFGEVPWLATVVAVVGAFILALIVVSTAAFALATAFASLCLHFPR
jgi:hypothetical protein